MALFLESATEGWERPGAPERQHLMLQVRRAPEAALGVEAHGGHFGTSGCGIWRGGVRWVRDEVSGERVSKGSEFRPNHG